MLLMKDVIRVESKDNFIEMKILLLKSLLETIIEYYEYYFRSQK